MRRAYAAKSTGSRRASRDHKRPAVEAIREGAIGFVEKSCLYRIVERVSVLLSREVAASHPVRPGDVGGTSPAVTAGR